MIKPVASAAWRRRRQHVADAGRSPRGPSVALGDQRGPGSPNKVTLVINFLVKVVARFQPVASHLTLSDQNLCVAN